MLHTLSVTEKVGPLRLRLILMKGERVMGFNRTTGEEVASAIDARIQKVAQEVFTNSPANRTVFGNVVAVSNGYYTVEIASHRYTNIPSMRNIGDIAVNTTVVCLIPNNEYSNMIILGVADGKTTLGVPIDLLNLIYPIGSVYSSIENSSPAMLVGGTWTQIPDGYALWTATSGAGETISAGLPDITGQLGNEELGGGSVVGNGANMGIVSSGAFATLASGNLGGFGGGNGYSRANCISFSASNSNSIYGNSATVQPPAFKIYAWIRVA